MLTDYSHHGRLPVGLACSWKNIQSTTGSHRLLQLFLGCGGRIGGAHLSVGHPPDTGNGLAGLDEDRRGYQSDEGEQKSVFDQVLTALFHEERLDE